MSYRRLSGVQSAPRVMRGPQVFRPSLFDVPLFARDMGADIEMPAECARPGDVMRPDGTCGPAMTVSLPKKKLRFIATPAAAAGAVAGMSRTTIAMAVGAVGAVGLIYYLSKRK